MSNKDENVLAAVGELEDDLAVVKRGIEDVIEQLNKDQENPAELVKDLEKTKTDLDFIIGLLKPE